MEQFIIGFGFGFATCALLVAIKVFLASLPRREEYDDEVLGGEATIGNSSHRVVSTVLSDPATSGRVVKHGAPDSFYGDAFY